MATGMITRHFEHPSGATATLEMPAGWSRNCYYILTTHSATNIKADVDRKTFSTPEESRQAAIAREREALANGWRPRMAARQENDQRTTWNLYRPTGEQLPLGVRSIRDASESSRTEPFSNGHLIRERRVQIEAVSTGECQMQAGDRLLFRETGGRSETVSALIINNFLLTREYAEAATFDMTCVMVPLEPGEQEAIERWHDRASIIQAGIEDSTDMMTVWNWLGTRISDASEKQQVHSAILRGREERRARLRREQEARERSESVEAERQREAARRAIEVQVRRPLLLPKQPVDNTVDNTEETLRRLSGGTDLNKKKKRKINLGE